MKGSRHPLGFNSRKDPPQHDDQHALVLLLLGQAQTILVEATLALLSQPLVGEGASFEAALSTKQEFFVDAGKLLVEAIHLLAAY
jgi:hypothetical protein